MIDFLLAFGAAGVCFMSLFGVLHVHRSRSLGSAALNCCLVAMGSADAYYEYGLHCWDMAAAHLIVREAGGVSMYPNGKQLKHE